MFKKKIFLFSLIKHKIVLLSYLQFVHVCKATATKFYLLTALIKHKQPCANKKLLLSYLQFLFIYKKVCKATTAQFYFLTALILILPENIFALGLGPITVFSKLNETLKAQIELTNVHSTNIDEIIVENAAKAIYNRAGLPKPAEFRTVRFKIIKKSNGSVIVNLTSKKAFKELYITFIADLKWKDIHLNREYTLLLDPAAFSASNKKEHPPSSSISTQASSPEKRSKYKTQQNSRSYSTKKSSGRTSAEASLINDNSYGPVRRNDTLSQIAQRVRPDKSVTTHQTMQALFVLNPKAFINNNINLLKQGQTLIIPTSEQVLQIINRKNSTTNAHQLPPQTANVKTANSSADHSTDEEKSTLSKTDNKSRSQLKIIPPIEDLSNKLINSNDDQQMSKTLKTSLETITLLKDAIVLLKKENTSLNTRLENLTEQINGYNLKNKNLNDKIERISNMLEQQKPDTAIISNNSLAVNNTKPQDSPLTLDSSMAAAKDNSASFIQTLMMYKTYLLLLVIAVMLIVIIILVKNSKNHKNYSSRDEFDFGETDNHLKPSAVNLSAIPAEQSERSGDRDRSGSNITKDAAEKESAGNINSESDFSEYFDQKINSFEQDHSTHAESEAETISSTATQDAHETGLDFELDTTDNAPDVKDEEEDIRQLWEDSSAKADAKAKLSLKIETYIAYGKFDSAKEIIQENLISSPEDKYLNIKLFEIYSQTNEHDEFMQQIDKVSHLLNTDPEFHQTIKKMHQDTWNRKL